MSSERKLADARAQVTRRTFLGDMGTGFTNIALASLLLKEGVLGAEQTDRAEVPNGLSHVAPKAKSVIWLFMKGGVSHLESFDPKPALNEYAGKTIDETQHKHILSSPFVKQNLRDATVDKPPIPTKIFPLQAGFRPRGQSGVAVSNLWPHLGDCVDDMSIIRSMWTDDNCHSAQLQFHTGRHSLDGVFPTIGAWVHYGLASLNESLPQFVVLGKPVEECCGGVAAHGADYLGPQHAGVQLEADPQNALPFVSSGENAFYKEQASSFRLAERLNQLASLQYPDDSKLAARIKSYELAFRMQNSIPEVVRLADETEETQRLYGLDNKVTQPVGQQCLAARRLVERGVRFVQLFHGGWDAHKGLRKKHERSALETDQPIAALLKDLKRRGLLDETLVVWGTEFGRTPGAQDDGRNHHIYGFSVWMAGGGVKGGMVHGTTDELGFHAVENRHYITDIHATVMRQLGLDSYALEIPGRKRLESEHGQPIAEILG